MRRRARCRAGGSRRSRILPSSSTSATRLPSCAAADGGDERGQVAEVERRHRGVRGVEQRVADDLRADGGRRERLDAEVAVELAARRIVDAGDDLRNPEHALRDQGGHDVAVVAVGHGHEAVGPFGTGALEHVVVDAGPNLDSAAKASAQAFEGRRVLVHDTTSCSVTSSLASVEPTRPQPTIK